MIPPAWGEPPWAPTRPWKRRSPPSRCDVTVVGGGLTGLACATTLARRGRRVVLLEARGAGAGASGRSGGIVLEGTAAGPLERLGDCIPALERTVRDLRIDCDLWIGEGWELVHRPASELPRGPGSILGWKIPGWKDGETRLCAASVVQAGTLDPARLVDGLARAADDAGACLVEGSPVRALEPGAGTLRVAVEDRVLETGQVVIALNAYTADLLPRAPSLWRALTVALCTAPLDRETVRQIGLAEGTPFYTIDLPYLWGRPLPDGRVMFGAGIVTDPERGPIAIDVSTGEAALTLERLEGRVRGLHPALAGVDVATRWGGPVAARRDRRPLLARLPDAPDVIVTAGYAGHGVALALRLGEIAAAALVDGGDLPHWGRWEDREQTE